MTYHSWENRKCYFPAMLSNGDIAFAPDAEGMLGYTAADYQKDGMIAFDGIVVRSARRSALCHSLQARLFPFGKFTFREGSDISAWSQSLVVEKGFFESDCLYKSGTEIHSQGFIHPEQNIYALQKTFVRTNGKKRFTYDIELCGYNEEISRYMSILYTGQQADIGCIGFKMYGMEVLQGEIHVCVDTECTMTTTDHGIRIMFEAAEGDKVSFYYYLEDDLEGRDFAARLKEYKSKIDMSGFWGMLEECSAHYRDFYDLGFVRTSDDTLNRIYNTSLYSIKCNATKYSIAVGFNNGNWDGRFFAFDEYTSYLGLLGSNRMELARRVPAYRLNRCLDAAIKRASDCHRNEYTEDMARFHWEAGEKDKIELSPDGNWQDHVFHMPLVGIGAFEYYEYTGDRNFLEECYKMIRACAKFFTKHMVYRDGERLYIGKCTDLERLGSSIENPFMTACGAIKLLQCCQQAAEILEVDDEYALECGDIAQKLCESLPHADGMYVPHMGCRQKSIAVFGGKFPFDILDAHDAKMLNAWEDFEQNGAAYGNMYPVGDGISPWYACWKALGYARAGITDKAYASLKKAYRSAGVFDDLFEINEEHIRCRPWFATAAGIFVSAVNDMLLQSNGKNIVIMPACPHDMDVCFKLAAKGGGTVEAEVKEGRLVRAVVMRNGRNVTAEYNISF